MKENCANGQTVHIIPKKWAFIECWANCRQSPDHLRAYVSSVVFTREIHMRLVFTLENMCRRYISSLLLTFVDLLTVAKSIPYFPNGGGDRVDMVSSASFLLLRSFVARRFIEQLARSAHSRGALTILLHTPLGVRRGMEFPQGTGTPARLLRKRCGAARAT